MIMKKEKSTYPGLEDLQVVAIIPARGGSRGIPRKNIINIAGKPLISYVMEAAGSSKFISKIFVTTDDTEIASVARKWNADVIMRPPEISRDDSPSELALLHAVEQIQKQNIFPDIIVFLQCTCPLTNTSDIDNTVLRLLEEDADTVFTGTPSHYFLWTENESGEAQPVNHDKKFRKRRQDCEPQYIETGSAYAMRTDGFLKNKNRFFGKTVISVIPPERVLDIDEPSDICRAESAIHRIMAVEGGGLPKNIEGIIFDFDGVFTDNRVIVHEDGSEAVLCNRSDGLGLESLKKTGIPLLVLSKEKNPVVQKRCEKIGLPCVNGIDDKKEYLEKWVNKHAIRPENIVYLGNDINDIECLQYAGCGVVVADAHEDAKRISRIILKNTGGHGAVRELCDMVLAGNKR